MIYEMNLYKLFQVLLFIWFIIVTTIIKYNYCNILFINNIQDFTR